VALVRVPLYFMSFINLYYRHVIAHILTNRMPEVGITKSSTGKGMGVSVLQYLK
jgi:hypothetical protein